MSILSLLGWFLPFVINLSICRLYNYRLSSWVSEWTPSLLIPSTGIRATHCAGQNSGVKTDGELLPGNLLPFTLHEELPCRGSGKTAAPATRVALATRGAPPLGIFWSVSDENSSEGVASSRSLHFHWELQSRTVSDQPSWISFASRFQAILSPQLPE